MGARPRFDAYGRLTGAELIPLAELGRPRIDVVATLSGIFRDLLPLQTRLLAEAAWLAASAEEPLELNFVRAHALASRRGGGRRSGDRGASRVFKRRRRLWRERQSVDRQRRLDRRDELADAYEKRKGFAYRRNGACAAQPEVLQGALKRVDLAYQNLESSNSASPRWITISTRWAA